MCHILSYHRFLIFLNTKTNVVTNLSPLNLVNNFSSVLLIPDLVFLSCSSESKEFEILAL